MRLLKPIVMAVLVVLAVTPAAPAPAAQDRLGPAPVVADCLYYRGPAPCIYNIGFIEARLSRHILHVGDTLTANYSWGLSPTRGATPLTSGAGLKPVKGKCRIPKIANGTSGSATCTFKAVSRTNGWVTSLGINLSQNASLGSYTENDYYAIIGKEPAIEGFVRREDSTTTKAGYRPGIPNVQVKINGPKFGRSIRTNENGYFFTTVQKAGAYRVTPVLPKKFKGGRSNSAALTPDSKVVNVSDNQVGSAEFKVRDAISVTATPTPKSVPANGFGVVKVDVTVERFGDPLANTQVAVLPNKDSVGADPNTVPVPARYCRAGAGLVWPYVNRGPIHTVKPFDLYTDAQGKASFSVQLGTIPGKLAVRVWVRDAGGQLQTTSINDAREDVTIDNTASNATGLKGFGVTYGQLLTALNLEAETDSYSIVQQLSRLAQAPDSKLANLSFSPIDGPAMRGVLVTNQSERVPLSDDLTVGANNGVVLTPDRVSAAAQEPYGALGYGSYKSMIKSGGLPDLVPWAEWATGTTTSAGWSLAKQDGPSHTQAGYGWTYFGYPYAPQAGGC